MSEYSPRRFMGLQSMSYRAYVRSDDRQPGHCVLIAGRPNIEDGAGWYLQLRTPLALAVVSLLTLAAAAMGVRLS